MKIAEVSVRDIRFPTTRDRDGSDSMNQGDIAPLIIGHISGNVDVDLVVVVDLDGNGDVELVPTVDQALPSTVGTRFRLPLPSTYTSKSRSTSTATSKFASRLARFDQ